MTLLVLAVDFLTGLFLHKLRPWTLQFEPRISDLMRYTIGLAGFVFIAPVNMIITHKSERHTSKFGIYENTLIGLLVTALVFGAGVVVGFILDNE